MTREENEIIISWIQSTALEEPIDETGRAYIGRRIKDTSVSLAKFRRSRNIAKRNNRINSVIELAQAITNTRKSPSAQNEAAMLELRK